MYPRYVALNAESNEASISVQGFKLLISYFLCTACNSMIVRSLTGALCFRSFCSSLFLRCARRYCQRQTHCCLCDREDFVCVWHQNYDSSACMRLLLGGREKKKTDVCSRSKAELLIKCLHAPREATASSASTYKPASTYSASQLYL